MHLPSTHILWTLVKSETVDCARFSCLDFIVTAHTVDSRWQLVLAHYVLTWLGEETGTLIKARSDSCR